MLNITEALARGIQCHQAGQLQQAEQFYRQILALQPRYPNALHMLGVLALQTGRQQQAVQLIQQAIAIDSSQVAFYADLGVAYLEIGEYEDAAVALKRALAIHPQFPDAHYNMGVVHHRLSRLEAAEASYRRCLQLRPGYVQALVNLGSVYQDLGRLAEAQQTFRRVLQLEPGNVIAHYNLGCVLQDLGQIASAVDRYNKALSLDSAFAPARTSRGIAALARGEFAAGWPDFEYRVGCPSFDTMTFPQPLWDGSPLEHRTLLVHCEQGLGDTLQFIRYVRLVEPRGGKIVVATHPALIPLLSQSGFTNLVSKADPPAAFDVHAPLLSLPGIFGTTLETVPGDVPYLSAEPARIEKWRQHFEHVQAFKIGIAWQGAKHHRGDRLRSFPLSSLAPLAAVAGVQLLSLQKGTGSEQIEANAERFSVIDLGSSLDNDCGAFLDTAAVIRNLDLVVTCDTAIGHLAGALGARVWLALSRPADWRWMLDREDSPWYPMTRLFRQRRAGNWTDVFKEMAAELAQLI